MTAAVFAPFVLALAAPAVCRMAGRASGWWLSVVPFGLTLYFLAQAPRVAAGDTVSAAAVWAPSLGLRLSFSLDGLALLFALLICGIGTLILLYGGAYLAGHAHLGRFYFWLLVFMGSMLGLVLADNLILLFVFWELTSLSSFFLIGFDAERESARAAALQALLVTGIGGLALLGGFLLIGLAGGSLELSELMASRGALLHHPLYTPMLLLVLAGAFTKSAQVPFHMWLPAAMEAPTPVSAYLHSATMVKAGVYLLARVSPILGGTDMWTAVVTTVGAATLLAGSALALTQTDLKRVLAYSTVGALGALVLLLGIGGARAATAAVTFLLAHALYKGTLFLVAGAIDHETGTRDASTLSGLRRAMPVTAIAAGAAAIAMMGVGPVLSFIAKELLLEATLEAEPEGLALTVVAVTGSAFFVAAAVIVGIRPFAGARAATPRHPHEAPPDMLAGPAILAALGLLFGIWPAVVGATIVGPATGSIAGGRVDVSLALWHGLTPALGLTAASLVAGLGLYVAWPRWSGMAARLDALAVLTPTRWYEWSLQGLNAIARRQTRLLQSGYLRYYLLTVLVAMLLLVIAALSRGGPLFLGADVELHVPELVVSALIVAAAAAAVRSMSRIGAVVALGAAGVGVALSYVMFSAPDLAITQVLVETLTVILFALVFFRLPRFTRLSGAATRYRDAAVALLSGGLITTLLLAVGQVGPEKSITEYYASRSLPEAHGRNVVNVVLVDFRSLDTLGEITVLALAGIGVYALLRLRPAGTEGA